ncbi:hypothetical protein BDV98DRAFT_562615 [Pterulicium gracile]|uniref:Zinc-finger domain-containing protein n=1 Tax=Pterulicium gracile TaxID=1884261 RepID=A0A5C3QRR2_9AGAR|nr:hypothetical protein BDV98DRAFT_562615 [Pterula gracilis]
MERPVSQHEDLQPAASTSTIPPTDIVTAEDFPTDITGDYFSYVSPLRGLPFLVARSRSTASGLVSPHSITSSSVPFDGVPVVDLQPLKSVFYVDPMKQVCRYESGGGECRNTGCDDVHLSRSDPDVHLTDQDIADYLEGALPGDWRAHHRVDAQRIVKGLQELRSTTESARQPIHQPLEQRVALLLRSLVREQ